jgi:hypothetical protein
VSPKRGDRVAPPPGPGDWDVRFLENEAAKGWEELCRQAPGSTLSAWQTMRSRPAPPVASPRHQRLRGPLARGVTRGRVADRWQIEVTGAGRVWYLVDKERNTIWVEHAAPGHPKATD